MTLLDPYAESRPAPAWRFLYGLNPLTKIVAVLPAMVVLLIANDIATPLAFLALSYVVILMGARMSRQSVGSLVGLPLVILVLGGTFSLWVSAGPVSGTAALLHIGDWTLFSGALEQGFATALRLGAIFALAFIGGLTTTGPDLVRATVQQLRVPYRIGYTALAAYRFVPRFRAELSVIRAAHRVRGQHGGGGPFSRLVRAFGYVIPLLAGAIRHAERVALAMDARAFGAYPDRTERHLVPLRTRDIVFTALFFLATAVLVLVPLPGR